MKLNSFQEAAVRHFKGPCLVLAGPGSGKTTIIINRIKFLIESCSVSPKSILVITFTKAAAEEMRIRFLRLCSEESHVSFGTFHSLFYRIIRSVYDYHLDDIIQDEERLNILKNIITELQISYQDEEEFFSGLSNDISRVKNELLTPETIIPASLRSDSFINVFNAYEKYKRKLNKIDFDDMIVKCYETLKGNENILKKWQNRYRFILIDEFQDINKAQYECISLLKGEECNVFAVGDDDQSIYGFRGARPEFLLDFGNKFENARIISTEINYRSTDEIIKLSNAVIGFNKKRFKKNVSGTGIKGKKPVVLKTDNINSEAEVIAKRIKEMLKTVKQEEIAVIYRTNIQARAFVDAFMEMNISFQIKDSAPSIYSHWIAKDLSAYLSLSLDRCRNNAFERIANKPSRYISKTALQSAKNICTEDQSLIKCLYSRPEMKSYNHSKIEELILHLNKIVKKRPADAIRYIRKNVDYNGYIESYAQYRNVKPNSFFEVLNELEEAAESFDDIEEFLEHIENVATQSKDKKAKPKGERQYGVMLTTMHGAKGLEFDVVFIAGAVDGVIPHEKSISADEIEEERRLFYVGLTRAKKELYISVLKTRYNENVKPSRFLNRFIKK